MHKYPELERQRARLRSGLHELEVTPAEIALAVFNPSGVKVKRVYNAAIHGNAGGDRRTGSALAGRSPASRRRFLEKLSRIDMRRFASERKEARFALSAFVTLTYPLEYPDSQTAKDHVRALEKRMMRSRAFAFDWAIWAQEYQRRGAVHYHIVYRFDKPVDMRAFRRWVSRAWYEVVGSGDIKHLKAGTRVDAVHLQRGESSLMRYLDKELSKAGQATPVNPATGEPVATGRTWGFRLGLADELPLETVGIAIFQTLEAWREFKRRVSGHFKRSPYLSHVASFVD